MVVGTSTVGRPHADLVDPGLPKMRMSPAAMFEHGGLCIAMGNASAELRQAADFVTGGNHEDGFADAVERIILGGDRSMQAGSTHVAAGARHDGC